MQELTHRRGRGGRKGIFLNKVGKRSDLLPDMIPFNDIKKIEPAEINLEIYTKNGNCHSIPSLSEETKNWVIKEYISIRDKGKERKNRKLDRKDAIWLENLHRKRCYRLGVIPTYTLIAAFISCIVGGVIGVSIKLEYLFHFTMLFFLFCFVTLFLWRINLFKEGFGSYRRNPISIAYTNEGLFVEYPKTKKIPHFALREISWMDIKNISENDQIQASSGLFICRNLVIFDRSGKGHSVNGIDDLCANTIIGKWKQWKYENH